MLLNNSGQLFKFVFMVYQIYCEFLGILGIHPKVKAIKTQIYCKCCECSAFVGVVKGVVLP